MKKNKIMKISVLQKHIDKGTRFDSLFCPISLAIVDQLNVDCFVSINYANFRKQNKRIELPLIAKKFILSYDTKEMVFPFEFELDYL